MTLVLLDMAISLDGYISTVDGADAGLYDWYFDESSTIDQKMVREVVDGTGAIVLGRGAYGLGEESGGFADTPYQVDHFVVTHRPTTAAWSRITFSASVEDAIAAAKQAAGQRWATVGGGADIARQLFTAGLIDEVQLHVAPVVLGRGLPLFAGLANRIDLELIRSVTGEGAMHLRYRVRPTAV